MGKVSVFFSGLQHTTPQARVGSPRLCLEVPMTPEDRARARALCGPHEPAPSASQLLTRGTCLCGLAAQDTPNTGVDTGPR